MGMDINLVSKPLSLSWEIFPGRLAIPAVINANTIIDIAMAPLVNEIISGGAFPINEKLPIRTQRIGQIIVQKSTVFCLRNSLIVLSNVAVI
jgi:hypothetical protein